MTTCRDVSISALITATLFLSSVWLQVHAIGKPTWFAILMFASGCIAAAMTVSIYLHRQELNQATWYRPWYNGLLFRWPLFVISLGVLPSVLSSIATGFLTNLHFPSPARWTLSLVFGCAFFLATFDLLVQMGPARLIQNLYPEQYRANLDGIVRVEDWSTRHAGFWYLPLAGVAFLTAVLTTGLIVIILDALRVGDAGHVPLIGGVFLISGWGRFPNAAERNYAAEKASQLRQSFS